MISTHFYFILHMVTEGPLNIFLNIIEINRAEIQGFLLAGAGLAGVMSLGPLTGSRLFPVPARICVGFSLAFPLYGVVSVNVSGNKLIILFLFVLTCGALIGWLASLVFHVFQSAGRMADDARGMAQVSLVDPSMSAYTSQFGMLFFLLACFLFLSSGAYKFFIAGIIRVFPRLFENFNLVSIGFDYILIFLRFFFTAVLSLFLPFAIIFFLADIAFGVINRSLPQLNAYFLMHSLKIVLAVAVFLIIINCPEVMREFIANGIKITNNFLNINIP